MKPAKRKLRTLAYGGGVNSTALAVEQTNRGYIYDYITFADTEGEKPETYAFLQLFNLWLVEHGQPGITRLHKTSMYMSLEDNCLRKEMLPSRAYGYSSCADKWKIQVQVKFFNNLKAAKEIWAAGSKIYRHIGIDAGESHRASKQEDEKFFFKYPLVRWNWAREECIAAIQAAGLPVPPKSACFFCPSSTKKEVLTLAQEHPDLYARAVAMERRAAPNLGTVQGLGRHWKWEDLVKSQDPDSFPEAAVEACTMCYDGEPEE